jgi:hypothetical protein
MQAQLSQISGIEKDLFNIFQPVDPDPDFISTLNQRLTRSDRIVLSHSAKSFDWLVLLSLGFLAGMVVWILAARRKS